MLRLTVIQTDSAQHHLVFTSHHILMDGWSNAQLLGEVLQHYAGVALARPAGRYRDYIEWLQRQDAEQSETFWRQQLLHLSEPTRLAQALRWIEAARTPAMANIIRRSTQPAPRR